MPFTPLDPKRYPRDPASAPLHRGSADGAYVYVQGLDGTIYILPDGPHQHSRVLGEARSAMYAGELRIQAGTVVQLNNCSGTFEPDSVRGLRQVADVIESLGFKFEAGSVQFFHFHKVAPTRMIQREGSGDANSGA